MGSVPKLSIMRGDCTQSTEHRHIPLHRLLESRVSSWSSRHAVLPTGLKFSEMEVKAGSLARAICRRIINSGSSPNNDGDWIVAVNMAPSEQLIITLLAIWKAGAAYLPLDQAFPISRVRHILAEAKPVLVVADIVEAELYEGLTSVVGYDEIISESHELSGKQLQDTEMLTASSSDSSLALVLYTSGSTGIPKGVRLCHRALLNRLSWQWRRFPYGAEETVCVFKTALTFVDSVCEIWGPLLSGRTVLIIPREVTKNPEMLVAQLDDFKIERLVLVPSLLRAILLYLSLQSNKALLKNLKLWVCSGEPLPAELARQFFAKFSSGNHKLCNFYGSTEVMGDVTYHVMHSAEDVSCDNKVPIGQPLDNTVIYLLDDQYRPVIAGEVGELYAAGMNLADGYVNNRDAEKFLTNPLAIDAGFSKLYRTGDFARIEKNTLIYEGRTDSQIKVRGHRVDLSEIERAITALPGIEKAVVLCYKPGDIDQAIVCFVTLHDKSDLNDNMIEDLLSTRLTSYMIPRVIVMAAIPLLVNGKVDRQSLLRHYRNLDQDSSNGMDIEIDYSGIPTAKLTAARALFETVVQVLGRSVRSNISASCNFYELGGNSLNTVYTVTRLRDMGFEIGISEFISCKCLGDVIKKMKRFDEQDIEMKQAKCSSRRFMVQMLNDSHKATVTEMITTSFYEKADLEQLIKSEIHLQDYDELIDRMWEPLVNKNLSFIVESEEGEPLGVALNFDAHDEPEVEITSKLTIVFEFLEYLEGPIRDRQLPRGKGQILHSFMMATNSSLSTSENVEVISFMEAEIIRLARQRGFAGVFTTNTSPLTQQLGTDVYKYQTLLDYQLNKYVASDGTRPFKDAEDWQRAICSWCPV